MFTSRVRRSAASALAATSLIGAVLLSATPATANAATVYYEWESEKSVLNLVMTARAAVNGARVGLATDNNSPYGLWYADHKGQNYWSYRLRASEHLSKPLCLDVEGDSQAQGAAIVIRECDNSLSQNWTELGGSGKTNRLQNQWSRRYIHQPNGPEFLVNLRQTSLSESGEPLSGLLWTWRSITQ